MELCIESLVRRPREWTLLWRCWGGSSIPKDTKGCHTGSGTHIMALRHALKSRLLLGTFALGPNTRAS